MAELLRQLLAFAGVGVIATAIHYSFLVALVELGGIAVVPATLCGFTAGGIISYKLNRRHTFASDRPHEEAVWRFFLVASAGFGLTYVFMHFLTGTVHIPYLLAQMVTTLIVMVWNFAANRLWTFRAAKD